MREEVRIERLDRLERFLAKVASTSSPPHLVDRWMQTLVELYLGYLRAENSDWPNSTISIRDALEDLRSEPTLDYIHDPVQQRANASQCPSSPDLVPSAGLQQYPQGCLYAATALW